MDDYDAAYGDTPGLFGEDAEPLLVQFADLLDASRPVLDVGCGQGRNALYLARRGFRVHALDPSRVGLGQARERAREQGVEIRTIPGTYQDMRAARGMYGGVLVFGLIPDLTRREINDLVQTASDLLEDDGLLWVTAFTTEDPACSPDGGLRTYLAPGELIALFAGFRVVHSWEGLGPKHRHGDQPVERHGLARAVLRK